MENKGLLDRKQIAGMNIHYMMYSLDYFLDCQQKVGIETIELWAAAPHFYLDAMTYQDCKEIRRKIASRGLEVKVVTPENCTYQYQLAAPKPMFFEKSFGYFSNGLKVASELGCNIMQINSGWGLFDEDREEAWKRAREMISRLAEEAQRYDILLAMESLRPEESQLITTLPDAKRMFDEVSHPNLKILIDTTAMSVAGETMEDWFRVFGDNIIHTHFIDSNPYGHLAWGDGNRDLELYLKTLQKYHYTGLLGQELTYETYYGKPLAVDEQNMKAYAPYLRHGAALS
ncbi:MAG: sugar phosphate isomerase/epimerase [Lachnospiraceae bacterium]|nr:sugar phosphate isomerase/epimerase [Lachnospiraceae bacterium]